METIATQIDFHQKKKKSLQGKVCVVNLPMKHWETIEPGNKVSLKSSSHPSS